MLPAAGGARVCRRHCKFQAHGLVTGDIQPAKLREWLVGCGVLGAFAATFFMSRFNRGGAIVDPRSCINRIDMFLALSFFCIPLAVVHAHMMLRSLGGRRRLPKRMTGDWISCRFVHQPFSTRNGADAVSHGFSGPTRGLSQSSVKHLMLSSDANSPSDSDSYSSFCKVVGLSS